MLVMLSVQKRFRLCTQHLISQSCLFKDWQPAG